MKRFLSIMLTMMIIILMLSTTSAVSAADEILIDRVTILGYNNKPIVGKSILEDQKNMKIPDGAHYDVLQYRWYIYTEPGGDPHYAEFTPDENTVYENGKVYNVDVQVKPHQGYVISYDTEFIFETTSGEFISDCGMWVHYDDPTIKFFAAPNVPAEFPEDSEVGQGSYYVTLYSRDPVDNTISGDSVEIEVTDGKIPECPSEFEFEGWEFWGWSFLPSSATCDYQPGDALTVNTVSNGLYASWIKKSTITPAEGGVIVDKYLSYYSGGPVAQHVNQGQTVTEFDYNTANAQIKIKEYEIIFPVEYSVIKYEDNTNDAFPVTLTERIDYYFTESDGELPPIITDEARETFINADETTVYENVNNLFMKDENGYWYYDSSNTHAEFDEGSNSFILYDNLLINSTAYDHMRFGFFSPFATYIEGSFERNECAITDYQHYHWYPLNEYYLHNEMRPLYNEDDTEFLFGVTGNTDFVQRPDGKMLNGENCVFEFCGDDIMYVYIDDILIFNAGTTAYGYNAISSIDFATGKVVIGATNTRPRAENTLYNIYAASNQYTEDELAEIFVQNEDGTYRFKDFSKHKFEFFYADTGATVSRMMTKFSLLLDKDLTNLSITKQTDGDMGEYDDAEYNVKALINGKAYTGSYTIGSDTKEATNGIITIKAGDTAILTNIEKGSTYKIEEVNLPEGFNEPTYTGSTEGTVADDGRTTVVITNTYNVVPSDQPDYPTTPINPIVPTEPTIIPTTNVPQITPVHPIIPEEPEDVSSDSGIIADSDVIGNINTTSYALIAVLVVFTAGGIVIAKRRQK